MTRIGVLIAARTTAGVWNVTRRIQSGERWSIVGIVDPRTAKIFDSHSAPIVLIAAEDLIWIQNHRDEKALHSLFGTRLMILLEQDEVLPLAMSTHRSWGFLVDQTFASMAIERFELAVDGYIVVSPELVEHLLQNRTRLNVAARLPSDERLVLRLLGNACSNREIAQCGDLTEARVKVIVRHLGRKLWLRSRTAVAVFSYQYGFAQDPASTSLEPLPA